MTFIFYSHICPPGRYWLNGDEEGICIEVKTQVEHGMDAAETPPPPGPEGKFSRIVKPLDRIAAALEGIARALEVRNL